MDSCKCRLQDTCLALTTAPQIITYILTPKIPENVWIYFKRHLWAWYNQSTCCNGNKLSQEILNWNALPPEPKSLQLLHPPVQCIRLHCDPHLHAHDRCVRGDTTSVTASKTESIGKSHNSACNSTGAGLGKISSVRRTRTIWRITLIFSSCV